MAPSQLQLCSLLMLHEKGVNFNHVYIRCIYGSFGREVTEYTVMYGVYICGSGTHAHTRTNTRTHTHTHTYTHTHTHTRVGTLS